MALLDIRHPDPLSVAVSLADNRASKAHMLRGEGMTEVADRCARNLYYDVAEFIGHEYAETAHGEQVPDHVCERLHAAVARARGES